MILSLNSLTKSYIYFPTCFRNTIWCVKPLEAAKLPECHQQQQVRQHSVTHRLFSGPTNTTMSSEVAKTLCGAFSCKRRWSDALASSLQTAPEVETIISCSAKSNASDVCNNGCWACRPHKWVFIIRGRGVKWWGWILPGLFKHPFWWAASTGLLSWSSERLIFSTPRQTSFICWPSRSKTGHNLCPSSTGVCDGKKNS